MEEVVRVVMDELALFIGLVDVTFLCATDDLQIGSFVIHIRM